MLGGPGSRRQPHLRGRRRRRSSRPSSTAGPLSRRGRPATVGGRVSAGRKQLRGHNRERGPYPPTASPSDGPGVRRFWPPAIELRKRGKSLLVFSLRWTKGGEPNVKSRGLIRPPAGTKPQKWFISGRYAGCRTSAAADRPDVGSVTGDAMAARRTSSSVRPLRLHVWRRSGGSRDCHPSSAE